VERKTAKLKREKPYVIEVFSDPEGLEKALDDYKKIYSLSWKVEEPYPEFIINIARKFAALGWLRLGLIYVEGEPAAAQIWFVKDGTASIFKLAYDEKYKQLSVGSILTTELMRRAIDEDKAAIIDYLTGDDSYKSEWMSHRRERVGLVGFSYTSLNGILHAARHFAGVWVRRFK
jgi:CelD/BcsL family acetyltransferase involved in cellulose biosynthesis